MPIVKAEFHGELFQPVGRTIIQQCEIFFIFLSSAAIFVDKAGAPLTQRSRWIGIQCCYAAREHVRRHQIVASGPFEIVALRFFGHEVPVARRTDIGWLPNVTNPRISCSIFVADALRRICRCVVRYQQREIPIRLREQRIKCFF